MADILLTEAEFEAIKKVVTEARSGRRYFQQLAQTAKRITRDDIAQPGLSAALDEVEKIDLEKPRRSKVKS